MTTNEHHPLVVLIILSCNQKDITLQCLESLSACDYSNKQIVLVDNGSEDATVEAVHKAFPEVKCLRNKKNLGAAGGRNVGIDFANEHYEFEYVMFMDNDIVVTPPFLKKLVEGLVQNIDNGIEIASPKLYLMGSDNVIDCAGGAKVNFITGSTQTRGHGEVDIGQYDGESFPKCVPTTVLMHRRALLRAQHFDISFDPYGYEDLDMVLRANLPGNPFLFVPESVVYHKGSRTGFSGYSANYAKVKAANLKRFLKRHSSFLQRISFYCLLPLLVVKPISRELRKGNFSSVIGLIKGFINNDKV